MGNNYLYLAKELYTYYEKNAYRAFILLKNLLNNSKCKYNILLFLKLLKYQKSLFYSINYRQAFF